jgi:hypothetical protein
LLVENSGHKDFPKGNSLLLSQKKVKKMEKKILEYLDNPTKLQINIVNR